MVLAAIGYPATVTEWSEYAGDPYRFRVEADLTGAILSDELHARLLRLIQEYKNTRSWLDRLDMVATSTGLARVGLAGMAGEIGTVYPWTPDEVEQTSPTYAAMALGPSAEIGEVYPLE
jgi:P2-related tail formation protein